MKTIKFLGHLIIVVYIIFLSSSCTKDSVKETDLKPDNSNSAASGRFLGTIENLGDGQYYGIDAGDSRVIRVTIYPSGYLNIPGGYNISKNLDIVAVMFYVNMKFITIPSGVYSFSNSDPITDGTFKSNTIKGEYRLSGEEIYGGLITVSRNNEEYKFDFDCVLSSEKTFIESFSGSLYPYYDGN